MLHSFIGHRIIYEWNKVLILRCGCVAPHPIFFSNWKYSQLAVEVIWFWIHFARLRNGDKYLAENLRLRCMDAKLLIFLYIDTKICMYQKSKPNRHHSSTAWLHGEFHQLRERQVDSTSLINNGWNNRTRLDSIQHDFIVGFILLSLYCGMPEVPPSGSKYFLDV